MARKNIQERGVEKAEEVSGKTAMSGMTAKILEECLGKMVLVPVKGGKRLRGKLKGVDRHLNLVLEETEDVTNAKKGRKLGVSILRRSNVILISPPPR